MKDATPWLIIGALATGGLLAAAVSIRKGGLVQLSPNFSLGEMTKTSAPLPNIPGAAHLADLVWFTNNAMEDIRRIVGRPILVNSGYRSPAVNAWLATQGYRPSATSDHLKGTAADFVVSGMDQHTAYLELKARKDEITGLDQLIWYDGGDGKGQRMHIGARRTGGRGQTFGDSQNHG